jgi:predicted DNA-binding transcriptional regulator YafY
MAKKRKETPAAKTVTANRAGRLFRLLTLLGKGPQTRAGLTRRLKVGVRDFYRDLVVLNKVGIEVILEDGRYLLAEESAQAIDRLPFPDPGLTLGEARQLAKGRSKAHKRLKEQIDQIVKSRERPS